MMTTFVDIERPGDEVTVHDLGSQDDFVRGDFSTPSIFLVRESPAICPGQHLPT
jgi:hypothetical protein